MRTVLALVDVQLYGRKEQNTQRREADVSTNPSMRGVSAISASALVMLPSWAPAVEQELANSARKTAATISDVISHPFYEYSAPVL